MSRLEFILSFAEGRRGQLSLDWPAIRDGLRPPHENGLWGIFFLGHRRSAIAGFVIKEMAGSPEL